MGSNVHVVPEDDQWAVTCEGHPHEEEHYDTQQAAIADRGCDGPIRQRTEMCVRAI